MAHTATKKPFVESCAGAVNANILILQFGGKFQFKDDFEYHFQSNNWGFKIDIK